MDSTRRVSACDEYWPNWGGIKRMQWAGNCWRMHLNNQTEYEIEQIELKGPRIDFVNFEFMHIIIIIAYPSTPATRGRILSHNKAFYCTKCIWNSLRESGEDHSVNCLFWRFLWREVLGGSDRINKGVSRSPVRWWRRPPPQPVVDGGQCELPWLLLSMGAIKSEIFYFAENFCKY